MAVPDDTPPRKSDEPSGQSLVLEGAIVMGIIGFVLALLLMMAIILITPPQNYGDPRNWREMSDFGAMSLKVIMGTMFVSGLAGAAIGRRWERQREPVRHEEE